jgi:serine/threonine protein kinase
MRIAWIAALPAADARHASALQQMTLGHGVAAESYQRGAPPMPDLRDERPSETHRPGDAIGPYTLIRLLGRGGMAEVWLARMTTGPVRREIALKLPLMLARHAALQQRFRRECSILSSLSHARIARLYEVGVTVDAQPYMAMEYVDGVAMGDYCNARRMSVAARVGLFLQLLDAVQHAHTQLVIHRDIKPANILVTVRGQVRLLDFGIAKVLGADDAPSMDEAAGALTRIGGQALTLDYASPEQILQQAVGIESDVYSLGVVLYELLCGARPYNFARLDRRSIEAAVLAEHRPAASGRVTPEAALDRSVSRLALTRQLRGDLDTILAKTLRPQPADRYATVAAFSDDLERWLRRDPIRARPVSKWYRLRRYGQRNWLLLSAAGLVALALIAATAVSLQQAHRAKLEEQRAGLAAERARLVSAFMEGVFGANSRTLPNSGEPGSRTARELLDRGVSRLHADATVTDAVRYELLNTFASIYRGMGMLDVSLRLAEQRSEVALRAFGPNSLELIHALTDLAGTLGPMGRRDASLQASNRARLLLTRIELDMEAVATAWLNLANVMADAGARGDAAAGLDAVQIGRKWLDRSHDTTAKIAFLTNGGVVLLQTGQLDVALIDLRKAMALQDSLGPAHKAGSYTVETWLGNAELSNGNAAQAKRRFESAIHTVEAAPAAYEDQWVRQGLVRWYDVTGHFEDAFIVSQQSIKQLEAQKENFASSETATPYIIHSKAAWRSGRIEVALQSLEIAEAINRKVAEKEGGNEPVRAHRLRDQNAIWWASANLAGGRLNEARMLLDIARQNISTARQPVFHASINYHLLAIDLALASQDRLAARRAVDAMQRLPLNPRAVPIYQMWSLRLLEAKTLILEGELPKAEGLILQLLQDLQGRSDAAFWVSLSADTHFVLGGHSSGRTSAPRSPGCVSNCRGPHRANPVCRLQPESCAGPGRNGEGGQGRWRTCKCPYEFRTGGHHLGAAPGNATCPSSARGHKGLTLHIWRGDQPTRATSAGKAARSLSSFSATPVPPRRKAAPSSQAILWAAAAQPRPCGRMLDTQLRWASLRPGCGAQVR